jgi:PsbP-like protein
MKSVKKYLIHKSVALTVSLLLGTSFIFQLAASQQSVKTYENTIDGIRVNYPTDWVVDTSLSDAELSDSVEIELGHSFPAMFCPEGQTLPKVGGKFDCTQSEDQVLITKYKNLDARFEFAGVQNNITLDDYLAFIIQQMKDISFPGAYTDFQILDKTDTKVGSVPAQLVELTYRGKYATAETRGIYLITLVDGTTGYRVSYEKAAALTPAGQLPPFAKTIFDSFEVIP